MCVCGCGLCPTSDCPTWDSPDPTEPARALLARRDGALELTYVPTNRNWGDGMTKSLAAPAFTAFAHALGVHERPAARTSSSGARCRVLDLRGGVGPRVSVEQVNGLLPLLNGLRGPTADYRLLLYTL